jgi:hypothetical protein
MINREIDAFSHLGTFIKNFITNDFKTILGNDFFNEYSEFQDIIEKSTSQNGWFTQENLFLSLKSWHKLLNQESLSAWLSKYDFSENSKTIGLVLAGNIPMVGFHDVLSVLISRHKVLIKLSSQDNLLIPFLLKILIKIEPNFQNKINYTLDRMLNFDAIIATGSNNTARYFEYYFRNKPHIIRKSRNSIAVLSGNESTADLYNLGKDIFTYFGLGCRNVSKLFVPKNYDFTSFFEAIFSFNTIINHYKYANNYDYNKTVYLMNAIKLFDNNFLILKEDFSIASPLGVLFYEYYENLSDVKEIIEKKENNIQCVVSTSLENAIPFGESQEPNLWDYADGVDTINFCNSL